MIKRLGLVLVLASTVANAAPLFSIFASQVYPGQRCSELNQRCFVTSDCCSGLHCLLTIQQPENNVFLCKKR